MFKTKNFISAAGIPLSWKIECDDLTDADWQTIAFVCAAKLPKFGAVVSVPRGGNKLAGFMRKYSSFSGTEPVLLVDDVWTTGKTMTDLAGRLASTKEQWLGLVAFSRGERPSNIYAFMQVTV